MGRGMEVGGKEGRNTKKDDANIFMRGQGCGLEKLGFK